MGSDDVVLPVVPMFHANAWGLAFGCPATGANMVMPGAQMDGASIYELLDTEKVTVTAAVPTVWLGLLGYLRENNLKLPHLRKVVIGGSAVPEAILRAFETEFEVDVIHAWGMTETSPLGTLGTLPPHLMDADIDTRMTQKLKQGRPPFGGRAENRPMTKTMMSPGTAKPPVVWWFAGRRLRRAISRAMAAMCWTSTASSTRAMSPIWTSMAPCKSPIAPRM